MQRDQSEGGFSAGPGADGRPLITLGKLCGFVVLFAAFHQCSYALPAHFGLLFSFLTAGLILAVALLDASLGLMVFLVFLVFADDISIVDPYGGTGVANFLTTSMAGVALGNFAAGGLMIIATLVALLRFARERRLPRVTAMDLCVASLVALYALAVLHEMEPLIANPRGVLNDLTFPILTCGLYAAFRMIVRDGRTVARIWAILFLAMGAKACLWLLWFLLGKGIVFGTSIRVSLESGRVLLVFVLVAGVLLQDRRFGLGAGGRVVALFLAVAAGLNILVGASRGAWLMTAFAFGALLLMGPVRDKIRWVFGSGFAAFVIAIGLYAVNPGAYETIGDISRTLKFWEEGAVASSRSTMVRVYEFRNIHAQLADHGNILLGEGPGSTFSDSYYPYPFGVYDVDYPLGELTSREFNSGHGLAQNLLLNLGYGGMFIFFCSFLGFYGACVRLLWRESEPMRRTLAFSLLAFLPSILYMSWSSKNSMLLGVFLGMAGVLAAGQSAKSPGQKNPRPRKRTPEPRDYDT